MTPPVSVRCSNKVRYKVRTETKCGTSQGDSVTQHYSTSLYGWCFTWHEEGVGGGRGGTLQVPHWRDPKECCLNSTRGHACLRKQNPVLPTRLTGETFSLINRNYWRVGGVCTLRGDSQVKRLDLHWYHDGVLTYSSSVVCRRSTCNTVCTGTKMDFRIN